MDKKHTLAQTAPAATVASIQDPGSAHLQLTSRNAQIERYRYPSEVDMKTIDEDSARVKDEWNKRLKRSIADDAARTNSWSLLWKMEAIYSALDDRLSNTIFNMLKDGQGKSGVDFRQYIQASITNVDLKKWEEMLNDLNKDAVKAFESSKEDRTAFLNDLTSMTNQAETKTTRSGGQVTATEFARLINLWFARRKAGQEADRMFAQLSNWTKCEGRLRIPDTRPPIDGFNHLAARVVEWLIWPLMSPGIFSTFRQIMLYGPAGAGKTVISQLVAFDIAKALRWVDKKPAADLKDYLTVYFVDCIKLRSSDPDAVGVALRNYLNCLQYEVARDKSRRKQSKKLGLLILDNLDILFLSEDEIRRQPRAERKASQLKNWIYKAAPEVAAKAGGQIDAVSSSSQPSTSMPETGTARDGGQASSSSQPRSGRTIVEVIASILSPQSLEAEWPDVRIIWNARYSWKLPAMLQGYVRGRQLFVDLPGNRIRRSYIEGLLVDELFSNLANRIIEEKALEKRKEELKDEQKAYLEGLIKDSSRGQNEPDAVLYDKEKALKEAVEKTFEAKHKEWDRLPIKPVPGNLLRSIVYSNADFKAKLDDYVRQMGPVLDLIATGTGMSLEGYCKLQTESGLSFAEVDMFLITTGKKRDGFAGFTPFGFTLEDLQNFFRTTKARVNGRLLKQAFETTKSFIHGSTRLASTGCKNTAAEIERKSAETSTAPDAADASKWVAKDGEKNTCVHALGPDLNDAVSGLPVLPLWSRFASHRVLRTDIDLSGFEPNVTPKADYPEFVTYVLYGLPRLNRAVLPPGQISQMCRTRPGPVSTFLYPPAGARGLLGPSPPTLSPWSVLFAPVPRLGGNSGQASVGGSAPPSFSDLTFRGQYERLVGSRPRLGGNNAQVAAATTPLVQPIAFPSAVSAGMAKRKRQSPKKPRNRGKTPGRKASQGDATHLPIDALFQPQ